MRRLLIQLVVDEGVALQLLEDALRNAGRATLPGEPHEMHAFVRAHLVRPLTSRVGPHLVSAFLEELEAEAARSTPPSSATLSTAGASTPPVSSTRSSQRVAVNVSSRPGPRPTVVLVDADRFRRATTSRTLLSAGFDVVVVDDSEELRSLRGGCAVVLATLGAPSVPALVAAALRTFPSTRALVRAPDPSEATRTMIELGARAEIVPLTISSGELVELVRLACE